MRVLILVICIASALFYCALGADQVIGVISPTAALIARETIRRPARLGRVTTFDYRFQYTGTPAFTITGIRITDRKKIKSPAATLTAGALGTNTITLHFMSQRGFGINALVEVYGTSG